MHASDLFVGSDELCCAVVRHRTSIVVQRGMAWLDDRGVPSRSPHARPTPLIAYWLTPRRLYWFRRRGRRAGQAGALSRDLLRGTGDAGTATSPITAPARRR